MVYLTFGGAETVFAQTCNKLTPGRGRVRWRFNVLEETMLGPRLLMGSCTLKLISIAFNKQIGTSQDVCSIKVLNCLIMELTWLIDLP